ncbi:Putative AC9 transposase [Linum perenne]
MEYLKKFYDLTCLVSGTSYVTSHLFFKEMCDFFDFITDIGENEDEDIQGMAVRMKAKEENHLDISELSIYLAEGTFKERRSAIGGDGNEMDIVDKFDVLKWWSSYGIAYPILFEIAKYVLAIPISTVASESAFSLGGRIMNEFKTSLTPSMFEALVCAADWLRSGESAPIDEEDVSEEEQDWEYLKGTSYNSMFVVAFNFLA